MARSPTRSACPPVICWSQETSRPSQPSPHLTSIATNCPASSTASVPACPGATATLVAGAQPWLGSPLRATANGLPTVAWVVSVYGAATASVPLATLLPQSLPGCELLVAPAVLTAQFATGGTATMSLALPASPAFGGITRHQQALALGIGATGNIVTATASNSLALTLGLF